jgi:hypothetical protein
MENKYVVNYKLVDTRNNRKCIIVAIDKIEGKALYTVKYNDGTHKRYYTDRLTELFIASKENEPEYNPKDYEGISFVDFKSKSKFADHKSWLAWVKQFNKVG